MDDLISRSALLEEFQSLCGPQTGDGWDNMGVRNLIVRQKTVDAVEVVRCKDCKYKPDWGDYLEIGGFGLEFPYEYKCSCQCDDGYYSWMPEDDWYCANGKRRENDAAD